MCIFVYMRWSALGPIQSHARLRRNSPATNPFRIHGYQAYLCRRSKPLYPHRNGTHRPDRYFKKVTAIPPNHRPPWTQLQSCSD